MSGDVKGILISYGFLFGIVSSIFNDDGDCIVTRTCIVNFTPALALSTNIVFLMHRYRIKIVPMDQKAVSIPMKYT